MSEDEAIPTTLRDAPKAIIIEHANSPGNPMFPVRGTEPSASQSPQVYEDRGFSMKGEASGTSRHLDSLVFKPSGLRLC